MDLNAIIELLGKEHGAPDDSPDDSPDEMTGAFLDDAVAGFSSQPAAATGTIRQMQSADPSGFTKAAVRLLAATTETSAGVRYVAELLFAGNFLLDSLLDEEALSLDGAISLARILATAEPGLDARLLHKMLENAGGEVCGIKTSAALRALRLAGAISDCTRLSSCLIQLVRHPDSDVRSKAALLLGRANLNLTRVKTFLGSDDARLRASAVESLWGQRSAKVQDILREAAKDTSGRASMNALLALCRQGDQEAFQQIGRAAESGDPVQRSRAVWAMGECGDPEFAPLLDKLSGDEDAKVQAMVQRSRGKLRPPPAEKPAAVAGEAPAKDGEASAKDGAAPVKDGAAPVKDGAAPVKD